MYLGADVNEGAVGNDVVDDAFVLLAHHDVLQGDRAGREVLVVLPTKYTNRPIKCLIVNQMLVTRSRQDDTWYQQGGGGSRTTTRLWLVPVRIGHAAAASYINMYKAKAAKQITAVSKVSTYKSKKKRWEAVALAAAV